MILIVNVCPVVLLALIAFSIPSKGGNVPAPLRVSLSGLCCESSKDPLGVDRSHPLLSWRLESDRRSVGQTSYRILASSSLALLEGDQGDLWDSGKVASGETLHIPYAGTPLVSGQRVFWKVRAWDEGDNPTEWSKPASWTMGLLSEKDWSGAQWISGPIRSDWKVPPPVKSPASGDSPAPVQNLAPAPSPIPSVKDQPTDSILLRREFVVPGKVRRATLFVCGLGQYEMFLNGMPVTDTFLNPGWTQYAKTCLYDTYDVTALVRRGENCVAALLGNSFFNMHAVPQGRYQKNGLKQNFEPPRLISRLILEYEDGSVANVVSDGSWSAAPGPLTLSHVYAGEDFDARLIQLGWDRDGFQASGWGSATVVQGPGGKLKGISASAPPIRFFETIAPLSSKTNAPGVTTYDFGQNASVVLRMRTKGSPGSVVRVEPAELIDSAGRINARSIRGKQRAYWQYTLNGKGEETYRGRFFYQGARYFQVELIPAPGETTLPELLGLEACVIHADAAAAGSFECSNDLLNRIWKLIRWAQRSNMVSYMTDCPTREKLAWLEQDHLNGASLHYNWDMVRELGKAMNDMSDAQGEDGFVPTTAPTYARFGGGFHDSPEWGSSSVIVPWQMYRTYGDINFLKDHYPMMKAYTDYLQRKAKGNMLRYGLGDWFDIGPKRPGQSQLTQREITATGYLYEDHRIVADAARLLGNQADAGSYSAKAEAIRSEFNRSLFNRERGVYGTATNYPVGSQCANALPLVLGIVEPTDIPSVTSGLIADIAAKGNTGGDIGYGYVIRAIADAGRSDLIYAMNNQSDKPGYGMMLKKGATALTEAWTGDGDSQNHFMLGQLNEWFFHDLAGIQNDPGAAGFRHILIKPAIVGDLMWVKCTYDSVRGKITSNWSLEGSKLTMEVRIPPNCTATVRVPTSDPAQVRESGSPLGTQKGIRILRSKPGSLLLEIGSGSYQFAAPFVKT